MAGKLCLNISMLHSKILSEEKPTAKHCDNSIVWCYTMLLSTFVDCGQGMVMSNMLLYPICFHSYHADDMFQLLTKLHGATLS